MVEICFHNFFLVYMAENWLGWTEKNTRGVPPRILGADSWNNNFVQPRKQNHRLRNSSFNYICNLSFSNIIKGLSCVQFPSPPLSALLPSISLRFHVTVSFQPHRRWSERKKGILMTCDYLELNLISGNRLYETYSFEITSGMQDIVACFFF